MSGHSVLSVGPVILEKYTAGLDNGHWGLKMRDRRMKTCNQGLEIADLRLYSKSQGILETFTITEIYHYCCLGKWHYHYQTEHQFTLLLSSAISSFLCENFK